jgi:glutamate 5-kinase
VGITAVEGQFSANQAVRVLDPDGQEIARGLTSMDSEQLAFRLNQATKPGTLGGSPVVIHRDAMVLITPTIRQPAS